MDKNKRSRYMLLSSHLIKVVLDLFISTFLISFIVSLTPDNVFGGGLINIGIFYVSWFITYPLLNFVLCHFVDRGNRVHFLRAGIAINTILLIALVFWGEQISKWLVFAGVICGISDAFYYSSYLVIRNELVSRKSTNSYNMLITILSNLIKVVIPTILGLLIDISSYGAVAVYVAILGVIELILTFFVSHKKPVGSKFEFGAYLKFLKENKPVRDQIKYTYFNAALAGFKNSYKIIIVILTVYTFKTNLNLGIFTSAFSLLTMLLLMIYRKLDKSERVNHLSIYLIVGILPTIACFVMCIWMNKITLVICNLFLTITLYFNDYMGTVERDVIIKYIGKKEYISEHQCVVETVMCSFRVICYSLFIVCGLFADVLIFKIFLCTMLLLSPVKNLVMYKQRIIRKQYEKQEAKLLSPENMQEKNT